MIDTPQPEPKATPSGEPSASHDPDRRIEVSADITPLVPPPSFLEDAESLDITFEENDLERLSTYLAILLDANTRMNLTAIKDPEDAWRRHILDALTLLPLLADVSETAGEQNRRAGILDLGSGGGVPGIPIAIVCPDIDVTLLDATGRKARFLEDVAAALGLKNVRVIHDRAETIGRNPKLRDRFDAVTARAVGHLAIITELAIPLVRTGGLVLAVKGERADQEVEEALEAIEILRAAHAVTIPTPTSRIVVLRKENTTPHDYPRLDGEPKRKPLGVTKRS